MSLSFPASQHITSVTTRVVAVLDFLPVQDVIFSVYSFRKLFKHKRSFNLFFLNVLSKGPDISRNKIANKKYL